MGDAEIRIENETLGGLADVEAASPSDDQALTWDDTLQKWVPETISGVTPTPHESTHIDGGSDEVNSALDPRAYPLLAGLAANRPTVGVAGRSYFSTDTLVLERDNGTSWIEVARGETATRLAQLSEKAHGSLTGIGASDHHTSFTPAAHDARDHSAVAGTFGLNELESQAHSELSGVGADDHHNQAHKDTHDPQTGGDPLDCAAPGTNITPEQANAEGSADTFARSDHMHYIPSGAPSTVAAANSEGTAAAFARQDHIHEREHAKYTDTEARAAINDIIGSDGKLDATLDCDGNKLSNLLGFLFATATELTLDTNGAITVTQMVHTVDTFEDAASDNLVTINGGTTVGLLFLRPAHTDRSIVVDTGADNVVLQGGSDITLDDITDHIMLFWDTTNSKWVDFGGGAGVAAHAILDGTVHTDSVADAVTRGSLIYGNATPKWDELVLGGARKQLESDGTDIVYGDPDTIEATLTNKAGANSTAGYVYRLDPDNDDSFDYGTEDEDAQVVVTPAVINDNASGLVVLAGYTDVYVDATTERGDFLKFGSTDGQAKPSKYRRDGAFAQATTARAGAGLVKAYVWPRGKSREYSLFDEPTWNKHIYLPLTGTIESGWTYVAGAGTKGSWIDIGAGGAWDNGHVRDPAVVILGNKLICFYSENGGEGVGVADADIDWSNDTFSAFTKGANNPIFAGNVGGGDLKWGGSAAIDWKNGLIQFWHMRQIGGAGNDRVEYCTCPVTSDYTVVANWTVTSNIYAPAAGSFTDVVVTRLGNCYCMVVTHRADAQLYLSTSGSPSSGFVEYATAILTLGAGGTWDDVGLAYPSFYYESGQLFVFYAADAGGAVVKNGVAAVGVPYLFGAWTKWNRNPILAAGAGGNYDDELRMKFEVFRINRTFYAMAGGRSAGVQRIGLYKMDFKP